MDERYVAAHFPHANVINVLKDAGNVFGDVPLHAVMGGFDRSGPRIEDIVPDTVKDMQSFGLKRIVPANCTGWRAVHTLANVYGDDVLVPSAVGRKFLC